MEVLWRHSLGMQSGIWSITGIHLFPGVLLGKWGWPARSSDPRLQNAEPFLPSPPGCALDLCEALSFPAISPISQTGSGLTPARAVFTQSLGFLCPNSFFPSKPKIFAPYLCKEVHALGAAEPLSTHLTVLGFISFLVLPKAERSCRSYGNGEKWGKNTKVWKLIKAHPGQSSARSSASQQHLCHWGEVQAIPRAVAASHKLPTLLQKLALKCSWWPSPTQMALAAINARFLLL